MQFALQVGDWQFTPFVPSHSSPSEPFTTPSPCAPQWQVELQTWWTPFTVPANSQPSP